MLSLRKGIVNKKMAEIKAMTDKAEEMFEVSDKDSFYKKGEEYWKNIEASLNGVLGGYGFISDADIRGSKIFLQALMKLPDGPSKIRALDCGAGVGRITQQLLVHYFEAVDLVEQNPKFLDQARIELSGNTHVGNFYCCGLQNFEASEKYDVIWCQWVLGHLTDEDLVDFLQRGSKALSPNGVIVVKENISSTAHVIKDEEDSSVTRPASLLTQIFRQASLRVIKQAKQNNLPSHLFTVKIFALQPARHVNDPT